MANDFDLTLWTDKLDYAPGDTATFTVDGVTIGGTVEFQVLHVTDPGADGIYGTLDDTLDAGPDGEPGTADDGYGTTGAGHEPFYVTDGVYEIDAGADGIVGTVDDVIIGDQDMTANGTIVTDWYVNPDDSLNETFLLTAEEVEAGTDGEFDTADDVYTGAVGATSFTDAGGDYSLNFAAADPSIYLPPIPFPSALGTDYVPGGRGDGSTLIPLADFNDGTSDVRVESLAPQDMALGQIVPFETKISVSGDTTPENGVITFVIGWNTLTTNGNDFGYDARVDDIGYGVIEAFIDTSDGAHNDLGNDAQVDLFTWSLINDEIVGIFTVSGLDDGDVVVLEPWLVLDDTIDLGVGGNVQSRLIDAATGSDQTINIANSGAISLVNGDSISTGNQTVPLLKPSDFFTADVDLSVTKTDDIDPIGLGETLTYTITASNAGPSVANSVVVYDVLDSNVSFVSASDGGFINTDSLDTIPDGAVQWNVGSLAPGESVEYTITVTVNNDAPTTSPTGEDLINTVTVTTISDDTDPTNNTDTEPTDVIANPALAIVKDGVLTDNGDMGLNPGDTLDYTFAVTNTGDVTITSVVINEDQFDLPGPITITPPADTTLDPGETDTWTGQYVLTQADIDAIYASADGDVDNIASATGTAPDGEDVDSNQDPAEVPLGAVATLAIVKDGVLTDNGDMGLNPGDTLDYTFAVTNTGDVTITSVVINEDQFDLPGPITITPPADTTLDPGETDTWTGQYVLTQADIDAIYASADGDVDNIASATGTAPDGEDVDSNQDPAEVPLGAVATLAIVKDGVLTDNGDMGLNPGDTLDYTFAVTNTGDVTITSVVINEDQFDLPGPITITPPADTTLDPGETDTWTGQYVLTQADIDAIYASADGDVDNIASATGTAPDGEDVDSNQDPAEVPLGAVATLAIVKDGVLTDNGDMGLNPGDTLDYTFAVTNTGDVTITSVVINEDQFDLPGPITITPPADTTLDPGETDTWTGQYVLTQADIDAIYASADGDVDNIASATGTAPDGEDVDSNQDPAEVPLGAVATLAIVKDGVLTDNGDMGLNPGDTLDYTFAVTNTGDVTITSVVINEDQFDLPGPITITPPADTTLDPGETDTWTGQYVLTQADIDAIYASADGDVDNIASATGTAPDGEDVDSNQDPAEVPLGAVATLAIVKDGVLTDNGDMGLNPGDTLDYTFAVTNTGDVTITSVVINEDQFDLPGPITITPPADTTLDPGETDTWTGQYVLTQADIDAIYASADGDVDNIASATGTAPDGEDVDSNQDPAEVPLGAVATLAIVKDGVLTDNGDMGLNPGDTLDYTFAVTNTGDVTITSVVINEDQFDLPGPITITPPADTTLDPGETDTWTGQYVLTQADIDAIYASADGDVDNIASATGTAPDGEDVDSNQDPAEVPLGAVATLAIVKDGVLTDNGDMGLNPGDTLDYTFAVTNTGDVTITSVVINEDQFDLPGPITITPPADTTLDPGETDTWTGQYVLTQADIDAIYASADGDVDNIASATGTAPDGEDVDSNQDPAEVPLGAVATLAIVKDGVLTDNGDMGLNPGDTLDYTFAVTNTGDVTITSVVINEDQFDLPGPITITPPADTTLDPGETDTWTGQYVLTQADIDAIYASADGDVDNIASATGTAPDGEDVDSNQDPAEVPLGAVATLAIVKDGVLTDNGDMGLNPGDTLDYTFAVTNTGDVTITSVVINEDQFDLPGPITITPPADTTLDPGETDTWTGQYVLTQADIDAIYASADGDVDNIASATGTAPDGEDVDSNQDPAEVPLGAVATLAIVKDGVLTDNGDMGLNPGDTLDYTFAVTNTGDVTITSVVINEDQFDLPGPITITPPADTTLDPGETDTWTGQYVLTQADIDAIYASADGDVDNIASATGTAPDGEDVDSNQDPAEVPLGAVATLAIVKDGVLTDNGDMGLNPGDTLDYTFAVTNTGDVTITSVVINEDQFDLPGPITITPPADTTLDPGETDTWTGQYVLTQADIDAIYASADGDVDNIASATGTAPDGEDVDSNQDPAEVPLGAVATLAIVKDGVLTDNGDMGLNPGDTLDYTFAVTNTGDVTITSVVINEDQFDLPGPITITPPADTTLDPGETDTWTGQYVLTQADIDAIYASADGDVDNIASATGTAPDGEDVDSNQDPAEVPLGAVASIDIEKFVSVDGKDDITIDKDWHDADDPTGPTLANSAMANPDFKIEVTNDGDVTLTNVDIADLDTSGGGSVPINLDGLTAYLGDPADGVMVTDAFLGDGEFTISELAPGETVTLFYEGTWEYGQHVNTATATGETPAAPETVSDADDAHYFGTLPGIVTSSSFCTFDNGGDQGIFNLLFTPDASGNKISATNVGQFYYNIFYVGAAGSSTDIQLEIPYPFVVQGATPIHVYDSAMVMEDADGNICIPTDAWGDELANYKIDGVNAIQSEVGDFDGDGDYETLITINDVPTDGDIYLNIHLDYDLKDTNGWMKTDFDPQDGYDGLDAENLSLPGPDGSLAEIPHMTEYDFLASADGSEIPDSGDSIFNNNIWKKSWGTGGLVLEEGDSGITKDGASIAGATVELIATKGGKGYSAGDTVGNATADDDGWWSIDWKHTGKQADYTVRVDLDGDTSTVDDIYENTITLGKNIKYVQIDLEGDGDDNGWSIEPAALEVEGGANHGRQSGEDLTQDMLTSVVDAAMDYWADQGVDTEALDTLLSTDIRIEDLGGSMLGQTDGVTVTLDDDAAGYGWSDALNSVDANEVDLLSALTHEFGHVLGYDHDVMDDTLGVGERDLPLDDALAPDDEFTLDTGIDDDLLFG